MKTKVAFWVVFFVAIFAIAYTATDLFVKHVMADFKEPGLVQLSGEPLPTGVLVPNEPKLEVKDNYGTQTDNHYKVQPAEGFTLEELNGFTKVTEL